MQPANVLQFDCPSSPPRASVPDSLPAKAPSPSGGPAAYEDNGDVVRAELADSQPPEAPPRRRVVLPLALFLITCLSTAFVGVTGWDPIRAIFVDVEASLRTLESDAFFLMPIRMRLVEHWKSGLIYMACVLAILLTHEMGHFVMTVVYRVRASLPYFIPLPISPIGTMGAVIGMDGMRADRKQIFDIGLAGPLAGLVVAIPITWIGIQQLDLSAAQPARSTLDLPLLMRLAADWIHPGQYDPRIGVPMHLVNPYLMAGWVGMLVTGLNMMPVSQLDGGHVLYALFRRRSYWIARGFLLFAFAYMGLAWALYGLQPFWILMAFLVLLIGTDHPPTRDDNVKLGWFRIALGAASLLIPIFCFVPHLRL